jgi:DNA helicase-2/ATP-dependent DNA helicase PcrA
MINYNEQFEKEYARLNEFQKKAVDAIYGPVMVIAGPGTGKTQILASRIGNILRSEEAQANAGNILCLTYTESAAVNMRQRLLKMIGPEAYRITINTFHAFCNTIIQENREKFGTYNLQPISDLERVELLRELIDKLPPDHALKRFRGEVYYDVNNLQRLFDTMEKENWGVEDIERGIAIEIQNILDDGKSYKKKGDKILLKTSETEIERLKKTIPAAQEYPNYRMMLLQRQRYTYNDMILWVIEAFKKDIDMLAEYQELFQYILVDEYQDTNGAQNDLIWQLAGDDDNPNIFVVGDDDQAIFRFQGASSKTMIAFNNRFSRFIKLVMLTDNYRSTQAILDASGSLINNNNDRLTNYMPDLNKHLLSRSVFDFIEAPKITEYINEAQQTIAIAKKIRLLQEENIPLNEVAIIYRNHKEAETVLRYFDAEKIPYNIKRSFDILQDLFIKKIITLIKYINAEAKQPHSAEHLLFEILHYDFFAIEPLDIARISIEINQAKKESGIIFWREKLNGLASVETSSMTALKTLGQDIEFWISNVFNITLQQLVEKIIIRGGILSYIMLQRDKHWHMEMLNSFFGFLKEECEKQNATLESFLETLNLMEEVNISLPLNRITSNSNGVVLTTAHGSKGEEYSYVFLINANQHIWGKGKKAAGFKIPQILYSELEDFDPVNDERRLFYVAMTRAKTHLDLSYVEQSMDGKELEKSVFIAELEQDAGLQIVKEKITEDEVLQFQLLLMQEEEVPKITMFDKTYIDYLLQGYQLSVTHLNNYLKCPVRFYFVNILHVPSAKNESMEFGSAMHEVLQKIYYHATSHKDEVLPIEKAKKEFAFYMARHRESFTDQQFQRRLEYGNILLEKIYPKYIESSYKNITVEQRFRNIHCEGIPINGILDKLEHYDNEVNVVDYKTGLYKKEKFSLPVEVEENKQTHETLYGGDYWRQAVFYSIILENYKLQKLNFQSAEFIFIEPDKKTGEILREKIFVTQESKAIVVDQIKTVWQKIHNHEFEEGCNEEHCDWCNFLKRTKRREKTTEMSLE